MSASISIMVRLATVSALAYLLISANLVDLTQAAAGAVASNTGDQDPTITNMINSGISSPTSIDCGTIASKLTHLVVKNPHYPEPTYARAICETVIERSHPAVNKLTIKFKSLELYRPNFDGACLHDRFAVYTDLNVPVTPVMCGNQTGKVVTIPFNPPQSSLIVSITTSDLDHDRSWVLEIEQENWSQNSS